MQQVSSPSIGVDCEINLSVNDNILIVSIRRLVFWMVRVQGNLRLIGVDCEIIVSVNDSIPIAY